MFYLASDFDALGSLEVFSLIFEFFRSSTVWSFALFLLNLPAILDIAKNNL